MSWISREKEAIVEFEYDGVFSIADFNSPVNFISLSDAAAHIIFVRAVDTDGNTGFTRFTLAEISSPYITTLKGTGRIRSVAFSPDGRTLAFASDAVTLWDIATGANIATFNSSAASVAFSLDGGILVSGGVDGLKLWDVATRRNIATLSQDRVLSVTFSADGTTLASGGYNIELWDMSTRRNIATMGHKGKRVFLSLSFSPDGTTLASGSEYHEIKLWDVATGRNIATMVDDPPVVVSVSFSPDGTTSPPPVVSLVGPSYGTWRQDAILLPYRKALSYLCRFHPTGRSLLPVIGEAKLDCGTLPQVRRLRPSHILLSRY